ncbi:IclR family transcriptional regulator [Derxia gummosa]|uniref:IclR family transcriptional regulator n=1 Tax=Derxia gummosa DSM 723 TaxID=1121388 RepID=A0A8B6X8E2_9BURK|nr:IclR family transcriptional regulator [Derxia gummosa]
MSQTQIGRAFAVVELLSAQNAGLPLQEIADTLGIPKSATHRLLAELAELGYVRQDAASLRYYLSARLVTLAFTLLAATGVVDTAQPILDRLAAHTGELVRLGVSDGDRLVWVAKSQGARSGLRYDPDMGREAPLSSTSSGHAWLSCLSDEDALALVSRQGFQRGDDLGPNAPRTVDALLDKLREARRLGYSIAHDASQLGLAAVSVPVRHPNSGAVLGTLSVAGPSSRLEVERMHRIAPEVITAAKEIGLASLTSNYFQQLDARLPPAPVPTLLRA